VHGRLARHPPREAGEVGAVPVQDDTLHVRGRGREHTRPAEPEEPITIGVSPAELALLKKLDFPCSHTSASRRGGEAAGLAGPMAVSSEGVARRPGIFLRVF